MINKDIIEKLKIMGLNEDGINDHVEFFLKMKKKHPYLSEEIFLAKIKEACEKADKEKDALVLDGDK